MNNYDPKMLEAWFRMMAEMMRTSNNSSDMMKRMGQASSPADMQEAMKAMQQFLPASTFANYQPDALAQFGTVWFEMMGMVPKGRYDMLERKYQELHKKLEESERTIASLRTLLKFKGQEEQAQQALEAWSQSVQSTLQTQNAWWQTWLKDSGKAASSTAPDSVAKQDNPSDDKKPTD